MTVIQDLLDLYNLKKEKALAGYNPSTFEKYSQASKDFNEKYPFMGGTMIKVMAIDLEYDVE